MKTLRLITTDPLALVNKNFGAYPKVYMLKDGYTAPVPPDGYTYVEEMPFPTEEPSQGNVWTRQLSLSEYGWVETAAPPEPDPEWYEVPAWRVRAIADVTPHGGGLLIDSISAAIDAIVDPLEKAVSKEVFFGGNTLRRDSVLLTTMASGLGLTDTELDDLFQQAFAIDV